MVEPRPIKQDVMPSTSPEVLYELGCLEAHVLRSRFRADFQVYFEAMHLMDDAIHENVIDEIPQELWANLRLAHDAFSRSRRLLEEHLTRHHCIPARSLRTGLNGLAAGKLLLED